MAEKTKGCISPLQRDAAPSRVSAVEPVNKRRGENEWAPAMRGAAEAYQLKSSSFFVTVMKSGPKKTLVTPSMRNKALARGEIMAARALGKSRVPLSYTSRPGLNLTLCGAKQRGKFHSVHGQTNRSK